MPPLTLTVVPFGMVNCPLPPSVPPLQLLVAPVRAMGAVPLRTPPCRVNVGIDCVEALLIVNVPPTTVRFAEMVPVRVLVPLLNCMVPAPLKVDAASKVRVSLEEKSMTAPPAALKVAPLLVPV